MRSDDDNSAAQRVTRLFDQARRTPPPVDDETWPAEWPPGSADGPDPGDDHRFRLGSGPRWQIPVPAAVAAAVLALLGVGVAAVLLLRGPSPGTVVPPRDPAPLSGVPTGLPGASGPAGGTEPAVSGPSGFAAADGSSGEPVSSGGPESGAAGSFRVYVVGQVRHPGVVTLPAGARVEDAVQAVGGATGRADLAVMNLARKIVDGERIVVPRPGEKLPPTDPVVAPGAAGAATGGAGGAGSVPGAPVDLNTATVEQLDALPGVGPVIAGRIVEWRQQNGRFSTVDDLSEVQGIGDATMAKLRPLVRV